MEKNQHATKEESLKNSDETVCQKLGVILESGSKIDFRKKVNNR